MDFNALCASEISDLINQKIGLFFGACSVAFRVVESEYFLDLVNTLLKIEPGKVDYKAPCRQVLSSSIMPAVLKDLDVKKKTFRKYWLRVKKLMDGRTQAIIKNF